MSQTRHLNRTESLSVLDIHFARLMARLDGRGCQELELAAALVSSQTRAGHVCLELEDLARNDFLDEKLDSQQATSMAALSLDTLSETLMNGSKVLGQAGEFKPLILERDRLYLNRYWRYQDSLASYIRSAAGFQFEPDRELLAKRLQAYFPNQAADEIDLQMVAAAVALLRRFCVITGGPGTGKTVTVAKIAGLLLEFCRGHNLRIALAAPTGKAAVRLQEAIKNAKAELPCSDEVRDQIPEQASTIHRLLGYRRHSPYFWHDATNPLEIDVLVVDEASMVDLALMSKLVQALPPDCRLILLGDNNQLASVEAGSVLADICHEAHLDNFSSEFSGAVSSLCKQPLPVAPAAEPLTDCVVQLRKSYRFATRQGIGEVSAAVNAGEAAQALEIMKSPDYPDVKWRQTSATDLRAVLTAASEGYVAGDPEQAFKNYNRVRILCAVREGPLGVRVINSALDTAFRKRTGIPDGERWYPGQPVLVTRNDYQMNLFNGDFGIILPDPDDHGELKAWFERPDGGFRRIRPFRLPEYEAGYAMTFHKSQGSEFARVLLLLPEKDVRVLTRELLYTGITRASERVEVVGDEAIWNAAVERRTRRSSGLRDALWS